jgi:Sec7-like guanine-nucleotide exchange factor
VGVAHIIQFQRLIHSFPDQAYVLAFSLIMLHTDAFNKSNKRKMTKVDYVKNTRLPGVPPEVLEVSLRDSVA